MSDAKFSFFIYIQSESIVTIGLVLDCTYSSSNNQNNARRNEKFFFVIWIMLIARYILLYSSFFCGLYTLCIYISFYVSFFYYYYFPFSHNFFFFLHFYLEIYYSILCGTLKSHIAFVRLVHHFVWVFMCFSNAKRIAVSTKTPQNILEKVISTYNHYYGYYESKNGEKKAPRKDTQTSVVMGLGSDKNNYYVRPQKKSWIKRRFGDKSKMATFNGICENGFGGMENFLYLFS